MSTNDTSVDKKKERVDLSDLPNELTERGREIWLAGLGALSQVEEEGDKVFKTLVDRGRNYETKRREQIEKAASSLKEKQDLLTSDVSKRIDDATKTVEDVVNRTVNSTLGRIGVPTRHEVKGLSNKVGELSRKLDALGSMLETQAQDAEGEVVYHVSPHDEGWAVIREGAERATKLFGTKKEAVKAGRTIAKKHIPSQLVVHKQDRSVQESFSYEEEEEDDA